MTTEITTATHPTSGDTYAVAITDGVITRAAGPLHHADETDAQSLYEWLSNNADTAAADGEWLQRAIDKSFGN